MRGHHRLRRITVLFASAVLAVAMSAGVAAAHPEGGGEAFPGEGVVTGDQHGLADGHLPAVQRNVTLVGKAEVTNPSGASNDGRIADVTAFGDYAYLNAFRSPDCRQTGVHVVDIHDPAHPFEVTSAFIPTSTGSYAGEGIQVMHVSNAHFSGDLLAHQNETCPSGPAPTAPNAGGISLWNVTDPTHPQPVALHTGDFSNPDGSTAAAAHDTHSMRMWANNFDGRLYVVLVDDVEQGGHDVDIMDITDPYHPVMVNELDLDEEFGAGQPEPQSLTSIFSHDMMIYKVGQRYVMNMNYWDGGYVLLDVTDPRPGRVGLIAESDYPALDEERLARGQSIAPEGNGHQSELSPNRKFLLATDEDFNPFRVIATIDSGQYAGTEYTATPGNAVKPIDENTSISGGTTFVGLGCDPLPAGTGTALVERGVCSFQQKLDNVIAAGYSAGIVFNTVRPDCLSRVTMIAAGNIPFVFVNRLAGLQLLDVPGVTPASACTTATPGGGAAGHATTIHAVFDGWGFVRLFSTDISTERGVAGSIRSIDTYAVPEAQDRAYARNFGALSVHEVAMDPDNSSIAYISYYAAGYRVVKYGKDGIQEIGAFIDEDGNNFWGVEVWRDENGVKYVLASDRDYGLYIFRANP